MMYDVWSDRSRELALVGRAHELGALRGFMTESAPRSAAVLLSGDAGVGKSRLLGEFLDAATADGWRALVGHCLDFGDTAMPYLPFTEMLRRLDAQEPELTAELAAAHPVLAQMSRGQRTPLGPADGLDRAEVFASMHAFLEDLADRAPLAVVLEDVHWADPSSRDLISFLLRRGFTGRVALVISYRSDDLHRKHPLRRTLAEWSRLPQVERLSLSGLPAADVRRMVGEILRRAEVAERAGDVDQIVERAAGNPFYVEELAGAIVSDSGRLPEDLADLLLVRLDRLDEAARGLVREASVGGQRVPHDLLAAVSHLDGRALDEALRLALDRNVLVRAGDDSYAFRHALLGEAVYDDLLPGERQRLHTAYATAIQQRDKPAPGALARHAQASHDYPTALLASIEAGEKAMEVGGPEEAARHFQTALELYDRAARDLEAPPDKVSLVAAASNALAASGHPLRALGLVTDALGALPADASDTARARLLLARAGAALVTESDVKVRAVAQEGLDLIDDRPSELRGRLLSMRAWGYLIEDDFAAARTDVEEVLDLAARLSLVGLAAEARMTLSRLNFFADLGEEARAVLTESLAEAQARGDVEAQLAARYRLGALHYEYAEHADALREWSAGADLARRAGLQWAPFGFDARLMSAIACYTVGDFDAALALADTSTGEPPQTLQALLSSIVLLVAAARGETDELSKLPAVRERWRRDPLIAVLSGAASIDLLGARDGVAAAVAAYDDVIAVAGEVWEPNFQGRVRLAALVGEHLLDAAATAPGSERAELVRIGQRMQADAEAVMATLALRQRHFGIEGMAWLSRVAAQQLHLRWLTGGEVTPEELLGAWRSTLTGFIDFGQDFEIARVRVRIAEVLRAAGRGDEVMAELAEVTTIATRLRATGLLGAARRIRGTGPVSHSGPAVLTPREREILALVAQGRSNGEIGAQLFISTKTVSVHVSNILAKLGASRRTEAAAIARRDGLV